MALASQLYTDRAAAGAAYASALASLKTAWINLRALDIACANANVMAKHPPGSAQQPIASFYPDMRQLTELYHPAYTQNESMSQWSDAASAAAATHSKNAT